MFPLSTVLFPYAEFPLHVFEPRYKAMTKECLAGDARFGIVLIARGSEVGGGDDRVAIGTRAVIGRTATLADGRWLLLVRGEGRIKVDEWMVDDPYPMAMVEEWPSPAEHVDKGLRHDVIQCVRRTRGLLAESGQIAALSADMKFDPDDEIASWQLCAEAPLNAFDAQRLLSMLGTVPRLELLLELTEAIEQDLHRMLQSD
jgi:Lon protease-like protein